VHWILGAKPRQDLVVVVPDEERSIPWVDRRVDREIDGQLGPRIDPAVVALVSGHGASVLCSAMRTEYDSLSFGGRWLPASTSERITAVSPHTAQAIGSTPHATERDVDRAIALARHAFDHSPLPHLPPEERAAAVTRILHAYQERIGVNGFAPDLWSPFGGYKQSGIGREYGPVGLDAYLEHNSIYGAP
jgi:hypothetical protein